MIVRATAKLRDALNVSIGVDQGVPGPVWYANLATFSRRKWLLLMHEATLFPVVIGGVRAADLREFPELVSDGIARALGDVGLTEATLGPLNPAQVVLAPTADRSMLGHLNQMKGEIEYAVWRNQAADLDDLTDLHRQLAETPRSRGGSYVFAIDLVRELAV